MVAKDDNLYKDLVHGKVAFSVIILDHGGLVCSEGLSGREDCGAICDLGVGRLGTF